MSEKFDIQLEHLKIDLNNKQNEQFKQYYELLIEWNKVMNLTGITDRDEVYEKHFIDSLAIVKAVDIEKIDSVIDIGTGAGFPGIPLKIAFPHLHIVLLDSLNKRINFLNEVIQTLQLDEITALHGRAEDFAKKDEYREKFDLSVSRAVANLSTLSEYCLPYIRVGGIFVSYKSSTVDEEIEQAKNAVKILGGKIENNIKFQIPESEIGRSFIKIQKNKITPKKYPRKAGLPSKEPL